MVNKYEIFAYERFIPSQALRRKHPSRVPALLAAYSPLLLPLGSATALNLEFPFKTVIYLTNHAILNGSPINQKSSMRRRCRPKGSTGGFTEPIKFSAN